MDHEQEDEARPRQPDEGPVTSLMKELGVAVDRLGRQEDQQVARHVPENEQDEESAGDPDDSLADDGGTERMSAGHHPEPRAVVPDS